MNRRRWMLRSCAGCAALAGWRGALAQDAGWMPPSRFARPELSSDEGGLWAMMDREETRIRRSPFRMPQPGLQDYLQGLVCKLGGEHCADMRVYPVRTPLFNASMAPNGMMVVWSGLLLRVENEAQLCAVLAHEVGHFLQRHSLQRLRDAKSRSSFGTFMMAFGLVGLAASMVAIAGGFAFSREHEREADRIGLALMERAGYDPREAATVWDNLITELAANPGADPAKNSPMFATHPPSAERRAALSEMAAGRSGDLGVERYQAQLAPIRFALLEDELKRARWDETLVLLERLAAGAPADAELLFFRGEVRRQRNRIDDIDPALADLYAACAAPAGPAVAHRALGYLLRTLNRPDEARASFARYLERTPDAADAALIRQAIDEGKAS